MDLFNGMKHTWHSLPDFIPEGINSRQMNSNVRAELAQTFIAAVDFHNHCGDSY
jgi:hypothetical protein